MESIRSLYAKISKNPRYVRDASEEKMKELVESLIKIAKTEEKAELKVLYNAVVENTTAYQADPSSANLKAWQSAKEVLAALVEQLSAKYSQEEENDTPQGFDDIRQVLSYLIQRGFKLSQAGIYKHQKEGKIGKDKKTGKYLLPAVEKYAKSFLPLAATGKLIEDEADALQNKKLKGEIRRIEAQAEKEELNLKVSKGEYIAREEIVRELVSRALVLDSTLRHTVTTNAGSWIDLVGGSQAQRGELVNAIHELLDKVMNDFASTGEFVVNVGWKKDRSLPLENQESVELN